MTTVILYQTFKILTWSLLLLLRVGAFIGLLLLFLISAQFLDMVYVQFLDMVSDIHAQFLDMVSSPSPLSPLTEDTLSGHRIRFIPGGTTLNQVCHALQPNLLIKPILITFK